MNTIWEKVNTKLADYTNTTVELNPTFAPHQADVISLIDSYWSNKYKDGPSDSSGYKKAFYNVILKPTYVASKMIDLDTKDVRVVAEDGQSYYPAWFFSKELKLWMKNTKNQNDQTFGQLLNDIVYQLPKYGHVLLKKAKGSIFIVPIQSVRNDPCAQSVLKSDWMAIEHNFTKSQMLEQNWDKNKVENVYKKYQNKGKVKIYEFVGQIENKENNYFILPEKALDDEILFEDKIEIKKYFKEIKWEDIPKRAIGRGQPEKLFENQIAKNTDENLFRTGLRWSSKHIFQSRDESLAKNLLTDIENGDLLTALSEITPIAVEERNLGAYQASDAKWDKNTADSTFSYESISGERPPAGTPLGTTVLQSQQAGAFFDMKREDLGMFLKEVVFDWIIPDFKKDKKGEHSIMMGEFEEDEVDKLRGLITTNKFNESLFKNIKRNGRLPNAQERTILKSIIQEKIKNDKEIKVPESFYDDVRYKIDIIITNEQIDVASRMTTLQTILQIIGSNPTILRDKVTKKVFYKLLDMTGISPTDLNIEEEQSVEDMAGEMMAQRGGSIAGARPIAMPQQTTNSQTL
ncbi:MAG: hypothetical protein WC437_05135 [Patescibacteria group bacterium]